MIAWSMRLPVGLLGVVNATMFGLTRSIAASAPSSVTSYGRPACSSATAPVPPEHEEHVEEQLVAPIAEDELLGRDAVAPGECRAQLGCRRHGGVPVEQ